MEFQKNLSEQLVTDGIGEQIFALAAKLYPICRSITGDGVRETLREIGTHIKLEAHEVPTGTAVFDWTIPREWNIRDAYIKNEQGEKIVDFAQSNLHVVSYSVPVQTARLVGGTQETSLYAAGTARSDSLSNILLCRKLGILHGSPSVRKSARRNL